MFSFIAVHNYRSPFYIFLHFEAPAILPHVHDHYVHAKVLGSFLGTQPSPKARVEKNKANGFIFAKVLVGKWGGFGSKALLDKGMNVGDVGGGNEMMH